MQRETVVAKTRPPRTVFEDDAFNSIVHDVAALSMFRHKGHMKRKSKVTTSKEQPRGHVVES
jgi:hypothetical protein